MRSRFTAGFLAATLLDLFSGAPARGSIVNLRDHLSIGTCVVAPDVEIPGAEFGTLAGCRNLPGRNAGWFDVPAESFLCATAPTGFPSEICGFFQLTNDLNALSPADHSNPVPPFAESGTATVTLTPDKVGGTERVVFPDPVTPSPKPASFMLIGVGLLLLGWFSERRVGGQWGNRVKKKRGASGLFAIFACEPQAGEAANDLTSASW